MSRCVYCDEAFPEGVDRCPNCGAALADAAPGPAGPALEGELLDLLDRGRKIEAVKRYREATGAGLAAAKAAVEAIAEGRLTRGLRPVEPAGHGIADNGIETGDAGFEAELLGLLASGRKIDAIKRHRERTGSGLKAAKEAVERLAARHGVAPARSGCLGMLLAAAGTAAAAAGGVVAGLS